MVLLTLLREWSPHCLVLSDAHADKVNHLRDEGALPMRVVTCIVKCVGLQRWFVVVVAPGTSTALLPGKLQ